MENYLARLEHSIGSEFQNLNFADIDSCWKYAAEAGGKDFSRLPFVGGYVGRYEFGDSAWSAKGWIDSAAEADRAVIAFEHCSQTNLLAGEEIDDGTVWINFSDAADDSAAENDRSTFFNAVGGTFADDHLLPPSVDIAASDAGDLVAVAGKGRKIQNFFEAGNFPAKHFVFVQPRFVGGIQAGEIADSLD